MACGSAARQIIMLPRCEGQGSLIDRPPTRQGECRRSNKPSRSPRWPTPRAALHGAFQLPLHLCASVATMRRKIRRKLEGRKNSTRTMEGRKRAGEGNRTPVSSLGSLRSTIELHPRWRYPQIVPHGLLERQRSRGNCRSPRKSPSRLRARVPKLCIFPQKREARASLT